jgi:hypothetical protein
MTFASLVLAVLPIATVQAAASPTPSDDGFRCATGRLVSVGYRLVQVRERCGEPDASERWTETRRRIIVAREGGPRADAGVTRVVEKDAAEESVSVEEWTYDLGGGRLVRHLRFENGRLVQVTTGSRSERKER